MQVANPAALHQQHTYTMQHDLFDITDLRDFVEGKETILELLLRLNKRHREGSDWAHKAEELLRKSKAAKEKHRSGYCEMKEGRTCGACHFYSGAIEALSELIREPSNTNSPRGLTPGNAGSSPAPPANFNRYIAMTPTELPQDHITPLLRPDAPGFFWCLRNSGRNGEQWHVVKATFIQWPEDDDDNEQIKVLACTSGGCWQRCDYINKENRDDGDRYFRLVPPTLLT